MLKFLFYLDKYKKADSYLKCTGQIITGRLNPTLSYPLRNSSCTFRKSNFIFVIALYLSLLGNSDLWSDNIG